MVEYPRPRSVNLRQMHRSGVDSYSTDHWRPEIREDCLLVTRPCLYVGCKYNLYLDVSKAGSIKFNFPGKEPDEMRFSCVLDIADRGGSTLEEVGKCFNLTRERIRQIEARAIIRLKDRGVSIKEFLGMDGERRHVLDELSDWAPGDFRG